MQSEDREMPEGASYESYKDQDTERTRRLLLISCVSTLALSLLVIGLIVTQKSHLYLAAPATYKKDLFEDVCFNGFHSIVSKNALEAFVEPFLANSLRNDSYKNVNVSPRSSDYRLIKKLNDQTCRIVIKSETGNGINLRSFLVTVATDQSYPFNYKVAQVSEAFLEDSDKELK